MNQPKCTINQIKESENIYIKNSLNKLFDNATTKQYFIKKIIKKFYLFAVQEITGWMES